MSDRDEGARGAGRDGAEARAARLGAALRANLKRRKTQDRGRAATPPQSSAMKAPSDNEPGPRDEDG